MAAPVPPALPAEPTADVGGVLLRVRVTPRAKRAGPQGVETDAGGRAWLRVAVTAPPEDGKANAAVISLLAKRWKLARRDFTIRSGAQARRKTILVAGDPATILARISAEGAVSER